MNVRAHVLPTRSSFLRDLKSLPRESVNIVENICTIHMYVRGVVKLLNRIFTFIKINMDKIV